MVLYLNDHKALAGLVYCHVTVFISLFLFLKVHKLVFGSNSISDLLQGWQNQTAT